MLMQIIKRNLCPRFLFDFALIQVQKDVSEVNDESSREGFSYNTDLSSICTLLPFLHVRKFFSHPIMQLSSLCTPHVGISPITHLWLHSSFISPLLYLPFSSRMTSGITSPLSSQEIWNTIQLWCFNTTLNCDHDFIAVPLRSQICCTSIPFRYT